MSDEMSGSFESSDVTGYTYNKTTKKLTVSFHKGRDYTYSNVPEQVVLGWLDAPSKGKYFWRNIRNSYSFS
jgi:lysyl-tRNA synthetase class 2